MQQALSGQLKILYELNFELSRIDTLDTLYREAIAQGCRRLDFDRMSILLFDRQADQIMVRGTYGINRQGALIDLHELCLPFDDSWTVVYDALQSKQRVSFQPDWPLHDGMEQAGRGWVVSALLWNGGEALGWLWIDNLLRQRPIAEPQIELLSFYGTTLGHLITHLRAQEALRAREAEEHQFQEKLRALHEITNVLSKAETLDDLYRQAVELGRTRLGYDRVGLWLHDPETGHAIGTFGTDEAGQTRDERGLIDPTGPDSTMQHALNNKLPLLLMDDVELSDEPWGRGSLGKGWFASALLWDGERHIGWLSADNLLHRRPVESYRLELLQLYATTVGHLITNKQTQEVLRTREAAELRFQEQLKTLHGVTAELSKAETSEDLYRQAVILGRARLGFDRLGLWLRDEQAGLMRGTFGTDAAGQLHDERDQIRVLANAPHFQRTLTEEESTVLYFLRVDGEDVQASDPQARSTPGYTWWAITRLWDGTRTIGWFSADNALQHLPLEDYQLDLLTLYGSAVGHLVANLRTRDALRRSEERFSKAFQTSPSAIAIVHPERGFLDVNEHWLKMFHFRRDEVIGRSSHMLGLWFDPEDRPRFIEAMLTKGRLSDREVILRRKSGEAFQALYSSDLIELEGETYFLTMVHDISEHKVAQDALRESEARFRALYEQTYDAVFIIDLDFVIRQANQQTADLLRCPISAIVGQHASTFIASQEHDLSQGRFHALLAGEVVPPYEHTFRRLDDTEFPGEISLTLVYNDAGAPSHLQGVVRDISQRKAAERARLELALQQDRVELLKEFIGKVTHDLKNPLSVINSHLFMLKRLNDPDRKADQIASIQQQVNRLDKIIQDVLEILRLDYLPSLLLEPTDPSLLVRETLDEMRSFIASKELTLREMLPDSLPFIQCSRDELHRALLNVLENAVHYTPAGGRITVQVRQRGAFLVVEVRDTGIGIAPEDLPHVVERAYRAPNAREAWTSGTGLGLALVQKIMEMHDGSLEITSELGRGSTFQLIFPVAPAAAAV